MNTPQPLAEKIRILAEAARYDVSCASSGSSRPLPQGGTTLRAGVCHSWAADGRCISLLKILMSNVCRYDCAYCVNRCSNTTIERASLSVDELVSTTMNLYRRNCIEGLFLSSGILRSPDETMVRMGEVARRLRQEHDFRGYIHLKVIPGAGPELVRQAGFYADRLSVNLELPSESSLNLLAPQKSKAAILKPMGWISELRQGLTRPGLPGGGSPLALPAPAESSPGETAGEAEVAVRTVARRRQRQQARGPVWAPAGQSTQMIVGASPESDLEILHLSESLYRKFSLKRVYFSAFVPVSDDTRLPVLRTPPLCREHRLYQADWLLRFYQFQSHEILDPEQPFLEERLDPKAGWALRHLHLFPVNPMTADLETLLRVPGIGPVSARRIVVARRQSLLRDEELARLGVVMKRAQFFLSRPGRSASLGAAPAVMLDREQILRQLLGDGVSQERLLAREAGSGLWQPTLFD